MREAGSGPSLQRGGEVRLGAFLLRNRAGFGSCGEVWRAEHASTGTLVAIKTVRSDRLDDSARALLANEAHAVAALDHPAVVRIYDHGTVEQDDTGFPAGTPWVALEWASEGTLRQVTVSDFRGFRDAMHAILAGLAHAHAHGVVHCDLKPDNVLRCGREAPRPGWKLADFGIARRLTSGGVGRTYAGTPAYMAPEQVRANREGLGPATDLFGAGAVAWTIATGRSPFRRDSVEATLNAALRGELPPFQPRFPVPEDVTTWLASLLAPDARDRFATAADAAFALDTLRGVSRKMPLAVPHRAPLPEPTLWDFERPSSEAPRRQERPLPRPFPTSPPAAPVSLWRAPLSDRLFDLRAPRPIGRQAEIESVWSALAEVHESRSQRVVLIAGDAASGRSALLAHLGALIAESGASWVLPAAAIGETSAVASRCLASTSTMAPSAGPMVDPWAEPRHAGRGPSCCT